MLTTVKITQTVVTPQYGSLSNGDVLRTTPQFAKHLVEQCKSAIYLSDSPRQPEIALKKSKKGSKK